MCVSIYVKYVDSATLPNRTVTLSFEGIWHYKLATGNHTWMVSSDESIFISRFEK